QQLIEELQNVLLASNENEMASQLPLAVEQVIRQTAANFSSTYQDVEHGRQTEIEFINGYVCKLGAELGVDTPRNHEIVVAIGTLEC
ncbi:MAG: ketopantoate reductase family protein, partial [Pseudomonadales bacterium]